MAMDTGWLAGVIPAMSMDIICNIGYAVNEIGFGLVIYSLAISKTGQGLMKTVRVRGNAAAKV